MQARPTVFNWIGDGEPVLYWDDPKNWEEGAFPNQANATAIFADALTQNTTILLRQDIRIGHFWFSEKQYSYNIAADKSGIPPNGTPPKLILATDMQYSTATFDSENLVDHSFSSMITHSCHYGFPGRTTSGSRLSSSRVTTIHFNEEVSNYKPSEIASMQVYGSLRFHLNAVNSFTGPVVAMGGGEVQISKNGAIPDGTAIHIGDSGRISIDDGILVIAKRLRVEGVDLGQGLYHSSDFDPAATTLSVFASYANAQNTRPLPQLGGKGVIVVQ